MNLSTFLLISAGLSGSMALVWAYYNVMADKPVRLPAFILFICILVFAYGASIR